MGRVMLDFSVLVGVQLDLGCSQWLCISRTYWRVKCRAIVSIMGLVEGRKGKLFRYVPTYHIHTSNSSQVGGFGWRCRRKPRAKGCNRLTCILTQRNFQFYANSGCPHLLLLRGCQASYQILQFWRKTVAEVEFESNSLPL
jgi:hypothetical protein